MGWPAGMALVDLDFSAAIDAAGNALDVQVTIELVAPGTSRLVWLADGTDLFKVQAVFTDPTTVPVPANDQPGVVNGDQQAYTGWGYRVTVSTGEGLHSGRYVVMVYPKTGDLPIIVSEQADMGALAPTVGALSIADINVALVVPHVSSPTPHPAYDDIPDLSTIFNTYLI